MMNVFVQLYTFLLSLLIIFISMNISFLILTQNYVVYLDTSYIAKFRKSAPLI